MMRSKNKKSLGIESLERRELLAFNVQILPGIHFSGPTAFDPFVESNGRIDASDFVDLDNDGQMDVVFIHDGGAAGSIYADEEFGPASRSLSLGDPAWGIVTGDVNNDGFVDAVTHGNSNVSVLLGTSSAGTWSGFRLGQSIETSANSVELGDIDQDGNLDLVVGDTQVTVYSGDGTGQFQNPVRYGNGARFGHIVSLGDADNDGDLDLLDAHDDGFEVLRNDGGIFEVSLDSITGDRFGHATLADMNDDGAVDLWLGNTSMEHSLLNLYQGNGDGTFDANPISIEILGPVNDLHLADMNDDSRIDVVIGTDSTFHHPINGNGPGGISIILANETGTFEPAVRIATPNALSVNVSDVNNDGVLDVSATDYDGIKIHQQSQTQLFGEEVLSFGATTGYGQVISTVGDLNGDTLTDYVFASYDAINSRSHVDAYLANGDASYDVQSISVANVVQRLDIGNFDGNAMTNELAISSSSSTTRLSVVALDDRGQLTKPIVSNLAYRLDTATILDVNSDGILDYVGSANGVSAVLGSENGTFSLQSIPSARGGFLPPVVRDFNQDQIPDLLFSSFEGFDVLTGNGDGTFTVRLQKNIRFANARVGDFNGDDKDDIVFGAYDSEIGTVEFGQGDGTFSGNATVPKVPNTELQVADLNNDGVTDLLYLQGNEVHAYVNNSNAWQYLGQSLLPAYAGVVQSIDVDSDGRHETVITPQLGISIPQANIHVIDDLSAEERELTVTTFSVPTTFMSLSLYDTDGDGKNEIIGSAYRGLFVAESFNEAPSSCDFDSSGVCDLVDLDSLLYQGLSNQDSRYDLDGSGTVDLMDRDEFFRQVGSLPGDVVFSGKVDAADLNVLGVSWLSNVSSYSAGDTNGDGRVDAMDLNTVGLWWQQQASDFARGDAVVADLEAKENGQVAIHRPSNRKIRTLRRRYGHNVYERDSSKPDPVAFGAIAETHKLKAAQFFARPPQAALTAQRAALELPDVVINEIMYHPSTGDPRHEYIELHNASDETVGLLGWRFTNGVDFTFPPTGIPPHAYMVVAADTREFRKQYPSNGRLILIEGDWEGRLANRGETIELVDANGQLVDRVRYADEGEWSDRYLGDADHGFRGWRWHSPHDGDGYSLELINPALDNNVGHNWRASTSVGGTPGLHNSATSDNISPIVTDVQHAPPIPNDGEPVAIYANVLDENASENLTIHLQYRAADDAEFIALPMSIATFEYPEESQVARDGYTTFAARVPAMPNGSIVEFRVTAVDGSGKRTSVPNVVEADLITPAPDGTVQDDTASRSANLLYQVLNGAPTTDAWNPNDQPITYLIMLPDEADLLSDIGDGPLDQAESNAQMNATFIRVDGNGTDIRYQVGVRNRGGASRIGPPNNYRLNFTHDRPWDGDVVVNLNSRFIHAEVLGNLIYRLAGLPAAQAMPVQVRVNGQDLAEPSGPLMFGSYAQLEVVTGSFPDSQFPDDRRGNLYRAVASGTSSANLAYLGPDISAYEPFYSKRTNEELNDWSDLIQLTQVLTEASDEEFVQRVEGVLDIDQWLRFIALDSLLGNREVGLALGSGDNYWLYRGTVDTRFKIIPHDLDTILGRARLGEPNASIFSYTNVSGLRRLLTHPDLVSRYYQAYVDLIEDVYNPETLFPLFDRVLGDFVPAAELDEMKQFVVDRIDGVMAQLPQEFTITSDLPIVNGYHRTTLPVAELVGTSDALRTRTVLVNGMPAEWSSFTREWSILSASSGETISMIDFGDHWKYLDNGSNQRGGWREHDYDDTDWSAGPSPLGYGNNDEATTVSFGSNGNDKFITTYFRHDFEIDDPQTVRDLTLRLQRDDGAIVYLNGAEVVRSNMPAGEVNYQTVASSWIGGGLEGRIESFSISPNLLVSGKNVLAIEVHQRSPIDDDIRLNASLEATVGDVVGGVRLLPGINRVEVAALEADDSSGDEIVFQRDSIDIWYDGSIGKDAEACSSFAKHGELAQPIITASTLAANTVLAPCGPAYRITGEVVVPDGVTLTIMPGTTLFFDAGAGLTFDGGRLVAQGMQYEPIRLTRTPATSGTWEGIQFVNSMNDSRLSQAVIEYAVTANGMVGLRNSELTIDTVTFQNTDLFRIRTIDSSLIVRGSTFTDIFPGDLPPTTDNRSEHIWGSGIADGGQLLIEGNHFGTTKGHNDAIDFDGAELPNPIPVIRDNYFAGSGDDAIDIESDALVTGNRFTNIVKDSFNTATGDANAISAGAGRNYYVVRNVFHNVDHAVQVKEDAFLTFPNNTVSQANLSAIYFDLPDRQPGKGAIITDSIFHNTLPTIGAADQADVLEVHHSIVSADALAYGDGNFVSADPRFIDEAAGNFELQFGSPAAGRGRAGIDLGAIASEHTMALQGLDNGDVAIRGLPEVHTTSNSVSLSIYAPGATHYRYKLLIAGNNDNIAWSDPISIDDPLDVTDLPIGRHSLVVVTRDVTGNWQSGLDATQGSWTVSPPTEMRVRINEVLANNASIYEVGGRFPDAIELYNPNKVSVDLSGVSLTDDPLRPRRLVFPAGTSIDPHGYLVITDDEREELHLSFSLDSDGEGVYLFAADGTNLDAVSFGVQAKDFSIGRVGPEATWSLTEPTFGMQNRVARTGQSGQLTINEWYARRNGDNSVQFDDDYIELFNADVLPVSLSGLYITDDAVARPDRHRFADLSFIAPRDFSVFQADGNTERGPNHLPFGLDTTGEVISLIGVDGEVLDSIAFFEQTGDWAQGRSPDGATEVTLQPIATPGQPNYWENPLETTIVDWDTQWRYDQSHTDYGTAWSARDFDDNSWATGQGLFAHGAEQLPEAQHTDLHTGVLTSYFRYSFTIAEDFAAAFERTTLALELIADDGAAVYVNGVEVLRVGLPEGELTIDTRANRGVSTILAEGPFAIPTSALRIGGNTIAVELHQISQASADAAFGLKLTASTDATSKSVRNAERLLSGLRITELMYHPAGDESLEFIELTNVLDEPIELEGVRLREGIRYEFPQKSLASDERVVVVRNEASFRVAYGEDVPIVGEFEGSLANSSDRIRLELANDFGGAILDFTYEDDWQPDTDGAGKSLVVRDASAHRREWRNGSQWHASQDVGGTPGRDEFSVLGDFDGDEQVTIEDVEILCSAIRNGESQAWLDLTNDAVVDLADMEHLITQVLNTRPGDANLDGRVDASDLNEVGVHWLQEGVIGWSRGDFNCDGMVDARDLNKLGQNWDPRVDVSPRERMALRRRLR